MSITLLLRRLGPLVALAAACQSGPGRSMADDGKPPDGASASGDDCPASGAACFDAAATTSTGTDRADAAGADAPAGRGTATDGSASHDAAATPARDAAEIAGGRDAQPHDAGASGAPLAGSLDGLVFSVECPARTTDGQCNVPDAARIKTSAAVQLGGDPNVTYHVRLHFCGPVEGRKYAGCARTTFTNDSLLCMDGTPVSMSAADQFVDTYPTYQLKVSAPAHSYFVNSRDLRDTLMKIDYSADLEIRGGASLAFSTTSRGEITFTSRQLQPPITCPDVPGIEQPFDGQFIHVTVLSVVPE